MSHEISQPLTRRGKRVSMKQPPLFHRTPLLRYNPCDISNPTVQIQEFTR